MVNRDYTQEIGLKSATRTIPLPLAVAILAVIGALIWFGIVRMQAPALHEPGASGAAVTADAGSARHGIHSNSD